MGTPSNPVPGDLSIDASDIKPTELSADQIARITKTREGFGDAVSCLSRLKPEHMQAAGINPAELANALTLKGEYDRCAELLPAVEKLVEILRDTKLERGHQVSVYLSDVVKQARRRAERDPKAAEALGILDDMNAYLSAPALKGAATRAKGKGKTEGGPVAQPAGGDGASAPASP
jgi:hypothetical protein